MTTTASPLRAVPTPCTGVCTLDAYDICHGCLRTRDEIGGWQQMSDAERERMMDVVLPAREAARA